MRIVLTTFMAIFVFCAGTAIAQPETEGGDVPLPASDNSLDVDIGDIPCGASLHLPDGSEVIMICESGTCSGENDVDIGGMCVDGNFMADFCELAPEICGFISEPETPIPDPPELTEAACSAAGSECSAAASAELGKCVANAGQAAANTASKDTTCFGNDETLLDRLNAGGRPCQIGDLAPSGDLASISCRLQFNQLAMRQCMEGNPQSTSTREVTINAGLSVPGFGALGFNSRETVTATYREESGFRTACASWARVAQQTCIQRESECRLKAQGGTGIVLPPPTVDALIAAIDVPLLGLNRTVAIPLEGDFRSLTRRPLEAEILYYERIEFLANWSKYLSENGLTVDEQTAAQIAFENAQRAYISVEDDLVALTIGAWFVDPETRQVGTPELRALFLGFMKEQDLSRRVGQAEETMMQELDTILSSSEIAAFQEYVWPGMFAFGASRPMAPRQILTPE